MIAHEEYEGREERTSPNIVFIFRAVCVFRGKKGFFILNVTDVMVWGGKARLYFHGVLPIKDDYHPVLKDIRINITFRMAVETMKV